MDLRSTTKEKAEAALRSFDGHHRGTQEWSGWLKNRAHRYAISHDGRLYPVKMILFLASGIPRTEFSGGVQQANAHAKRLGFNVVEIRPQVQNPYWALFADPKRYRILDAIDALEVDWWTTRGKPLKKGDGVVIWQGLDRSGHRGVVALGEVASEPDKERADIANPFWIDREGAAAKIERVAIRYVPLRERLWIAGPHRELVEGLRVAKARGGTVFHVSEDQWSALTPFIADSRIDPLTAAHASSGGQGFGLTPAQRRAVEDYAMQIAQQHFEKVWDKVMDVSAARPYDLECRSGSKILHVEVKGTTGGGASVLLTKNEVDHARCFYPNVALFVVREIELIGAAEAPQVGGGSARLIEPWDIGECDLQPLSYKCHLPDASDSES